MGKKQGEFSNDKGPWKWGLYNNPEDPRAFVPKRFKYLGWTINLGSAKGRKATWGLLVFLLAVVGLVAYSGAKDYQFRVEESRVTIQAAMYNTSFDKSEVVSVKAIQAIPKGMRTNGYGGMNKSFGHFSIEGYGKCMLYIYKDVKKYVVVELSGSKPAYVIFNGKTLEETDALYSTIKSWHQK